MSDVKKPHVFVRNDEEPGPWLWCGELPRIVRDSDGKYDAAAFHKDCNDFFKFVGEIVFNEINADMGGTDSDVFRLEVKVKEMTDAEVEAMPED